MNEQRPCTYIVAPDTIENHYEVTGECGSGGFGVVQLCRRVRRPVLRNVVLKSIAKDESHFRDCVLGEDKGEYQKLFLQFDHPNVVHYYDFLEDDKYAYMVMPRLSGPSLWAHLKKVRTISERSAQKHMIQLLNGLKYIHSLGIVHRDVNPDNLVFESESETNLKLIDFGLCAMDQQPNETGSVIGTLLFIAPEVFRGVYSEALDLWSAGVVFHLIVAGCYPFNASNSGQLVAAIGEGLDTSKLPWVWAYLTSACKQLVCSMLDVDPLSRINASNAIEHEWFAVPGADRKLLNNLAFEIAREETPDIPCEEPSENHVVIDIDDPTQSKILDSWVVKSQSLPPRLCRKTCPAVEDTHLHERRYTDVIEYQKTHQTQRHTNKPDECSQRLVHGLLSTGFCIVRSSVNSLQQALPDMGTGTKWDATVATFTINLGVSLLSTPYALGKVGIVGIPLLVFFTFCSGFTTQLMAWTLNAQSSKAEKLGIPREARDWSFLAGEAFGSRAKVILVGVLILLLFGYLVALTVVIAVHMNLLVPEISKTNGVFISSFVTFVLCFTPQRAFTQLTVILNVVFCMACGFFVATGLMLPEMAPVSEFKAIDSQEIVASSGIFVFIASSHVCFPAIMQNMAEPQQYAACARRSYSGLIVFYLLLAVSGYMCFGDSLKESFVQNIARDRNAKLIPGFGWMIPFSAAGIVLKVSVMQPLILVPFVQSLMILIPKIPKLMMIVVSLGVTALVSALLADKMAMVFSVIGTVLCMNITFVLPAACYWRLVGQSSCWPKKLGYLGLIFIGISFAVLGLLNTLGIF